MSMRITNLGTVGVVCKNDEGEYLGASARVFLGITEPAALEALACREALALASDLGLNQAVIDSDCKEVLTNIKDGNG